MPVPRRRDRGVILVLPGGGYRRHAPHEAEPVAEWLSSLGWASRVVRYPVLTRHPGPLAAVRYEIAAERARGAHAVGVIGFSAGGHLAGLAALAPDSSPDERPDFAVLGYPAVSLVHHPHPGSRSVLVGDPGPEETALELSLERLVAPDSPPMFVWHTAGDRVVPVEHSYLLGTALAAAGVGHELHVFPGDVHGIGLAVDTDAAAWTSLAAAWLDRR